MLLKFKIKIILKFIFLFNICSIIILFLITQQLHAQKWTTNLDIFSSYIWRGAKFGSGPAFQPSVKFEAGDFTIGAWGSCNASVNEAAEADLYIGYDLIMREHAALTLTVTDYYFPGTSWLKKEAHYIEPLISVSAGRFSITGAYIMNQGEGDTYIEAGYSAKSANLFIGSGNGVYTTDGKFNLCNIGISSRKEIVITETFLLPLSGAVILNPSSEQLYVVVGILL